jgi:hypothetical protein
MELASLRRLIRTRPAGWLLAFALVWLPAAQWAAAAHAFLHLRAASTSDSERPAHLPASSCELCVVAASIGGAAPTAHPIAPAIVALPQAMEPAPPATIAWRAPASPYRSRAPPLLTA